jgi:cytochrome c
MIPRAEPFARFGYHEYPRPAWARLSTSKMKFRMRAMIRKLVCSMLCLLPVAAWSQFQGAPATSKACLACHQVDTRRVGPPLRSVAERYAGQPQAMDYLVNKILHGSRGDWGAVPMPAQSQLSQAQAQELVKWILSLSAQH